MTSSGYIEPTGDGRAGFMGPDGKLFTRRIQTPWERFVEEEGIPVFKGIGVRDCRELPRVDWVRLGAKATFVQLIGTNNTDCMTVIEIPPHASIKPQKHMYEERFTVLDGNGVTDVWRDGSSAKSSFDWQQWSMFSVPLNANFQIKNDSSSPAILVGVNSAPRVINMFNSKSFLFETSFNFDERFGGNLEDYWQPGGEFEHQPVKGRAMLTTNLIPDASTTYLPLDNNRGPGYRWVAPNMAGNSMIQGWIAEYPSGRYAKAHAHASGAVLLCLKGKGFSIAWPREAGITPWRDGKGELVKMTEYVAGGLVSAAPGPADWFHQHFAFGQEPFRISLYNGNVPGMSGGFGFGGGGDEAPGSTRLYASHTNIDEGGVAIPYYLEDPYLRSYFEEKCAREGAAVTMPPEVYTKEGANIRIIED